MSLLKKILQTTALYLFVNYAFAVGGVSRACRFDTIPEGLKNISAAFFVALGAPNSVLDIPSLPLEQQSNYYILESITTDYGHVRYWLFATSGQYLTVYHDWDPNQPYRPELFRTFQTEWTAEQVSAVTTLNPKFASFFTNRGFLYSARAGSSEIVENMGGFNNRPYPDRFHVVGRHYYFDPASKAMYEVARSKASDCNLKDWGFFDR